VEGAFALRLDLDVVRARQAARMDVIVPPRHGHFGCDRIEYAALYARSRAAHAPTSTI